MRYRAHFGDGIAAVVFHTLPTDARDALIQRVTTLAEHPLDSDLQSPGKDERERQTTFGPDDRGILEFFVDDDAELIRISRIIWMD